MPHNDLKEICNQKIKSFIMKKTVLITGASSGFGKASAKLFQNQGWNVIAAMRSPEKEEELKDSENLLLVKLDVTDLESIKKSVEQGLEKFSTIDVLINSAGYGLIGVFESSDETQIQKQFEVNVFGLMNMTKAILPAMRKQKSGVIVNISSFGGVTALLQVYTTVRNLPLKVFLKHCILNCHLLGFPLKLWNPEALRPISETEWK